MLRYHFVRDAKLALGSILLKRLAISRFCGVPWSEAVPTRDERTKPVFRLPGSGAQPLLFNVSHQAGLVVLFAVHDPAGFIGDDALAIGVDVVCPAERRERDHGMIAAEGWARFVDIHDEVFSPGEVATLKTQRPSGGEGWDGPLAHFYALWCLREAYVKMTGEALLASWLRELDLRGFGPPGKGEGHTGTTETQGLEVWFRGERLGDADVRMSWLLDDYMVCTAVRRGRDGKSLEVGEFEMLDIENVLEAAEKA